MKTSPSGTTTCETSLKLLADFWNLKIIESLEKESLRYCEIQRAVGNVNPATLTKKLHTLEEAKLIERYENTEHAMVHYSLTKRGQSALPVLHAISAFALKI